MKKLYPLILAGFLVVPSVSVANDCGGVCGAGDFDERDFACWWVLIDPCFFEGR